MCEVTRGPCVCVLQADAVPAGNARMSMPDSSVKTAGSWVIANFLWQKVMGLCGPLLLDLCVQNEDEETTGVFEVNTFFLNLRQDKGVYVHKHMHKNEQIKIAIFHFSHRSVMQQGAGLA